LCLRALSEIDVRGTRVLDLGTGSGVLAMAASLKGAREVLAIDVDPDAIDAARESAPLNPLPVGIEFGVADFRATSAALEPSHYDVVLANLTGGMLTQVAPRIMDLVAPGGMVVISGFDEREREGVRDAFAALAEAAAYAEDGWVGLALRSPS
jgi:ribosomal protein L11 methyltransferase